MRRLPGGWRTAAGSAAVFLLLLVPVRLPAGERWMEAWSAAAHVVLFAALAWLWERRHSAVRRGWRLWLVLAAVAAGVEGLQFWTGRSVGWTDWWSGAAGAACVCATWRIRSGVRLLGVLALAFLPAAREATLQELERRDFPVLAAPECRWAARGWMENGGRLHREEEGFRFLPDKPASPSAYPGVFRVPAAQDWRMTKALEASLFWPGDKPAVMGLRVDDRPGQPSYPERFQREFTVTQGWNRVRIPVRELGRTPGGRPLRLDCIRRWGVFLVSDKAFDYFLLGPVRLTLQEELP